MLNRREAVAALAAGAVAGGASGAEPAFQFAALDHLALAVNDTEKSVRFYTRLLGNNVMKEKTNPRHYVKAGPVYVAMAPPAGRGASGNSINHFCPGIASFDLAATKRKLEQLGLKYSEAPGVGVFVPDPDGTLVQLWTQDSWSHLNETAAPAGIAAQGEPLLRPSAFDHILINVSDLDRSVEFYEKVLGPVITPASRPRRTWFRAGTGTAGNRVGLALVDAGQKPGIDHYCFTAPFERAALTKAVEALGAKMIQGDVAAGIDFLDVNGIHVQVIPPA